ncbi:HU family DNA-binding protein (plasmid) [Pseudomonas silesiensis]|uniref:HU family DNA-binding protein n=1 Tax=Pseudomonas silesiensis TaxID=1853130 RepID=UPI0030CAAE4C
MSKQDLIDKIHESVSGVTKKAIGDVLSALPAALVAEMHANNGAVTLPGIINVTTVEREARTGRNPSTGAAIQIAAKKVVKVKAIGDLKKAV